MRAKVIPLLLGLVGLGLGAGAGFYLRPASEIAVPEKAEAGDHDATEADHTAADQESDTAQAPEYVKLNNQFVVPVLKNGEVASMVVLALSLEVTKGSTEQVYAREPKLRDAILQVLFDHANSGGFAGEFTDGANLILLRKALLEVAQSTLGDLVLDVLISDIARQDS